MPDGNERWWSSWNLLILASLVSAAAVGVAVITESTISTPVSPPLVVARWIVYALFVVTLLMIQQWLPRPTVLSLEALHLILVVLATTLVVLTPHQVWMLMLYVLSATMAAFIWRPRRVFVLIAVQILLIVGVAVVNAWPPMEFALAVAGFGSIQVFGVVVVFIMRAEAEARRELAIAHAELRATAALLELTTREAERLRISRDLHDLAGHDLTALSLELEVASHPSVGSRGDEHVRRAKSIAKNLLGTIRAAVGAMRHEAPALQPALAQLAAGVPQLEVEVSVDPEIVLDADRVIVVLRSVQEAITNILRHSTSDSARVAVRADGRFIQVTVSDQGTGTGSIVPGNGLTGMRERFEALGGSLDVTSNPGRGTTITGRLPRLIGS